MKKTALLILLSLFLQIPVFADVVVYNDNSKFGLKDEQGNIITEAKYKKLIRLGETAWIMQEGSKFGIIHDSGKVLTEPKFNQAERVLGKYVKFRKGDKYGIYDEMGFDILPVEYLSIDLLYGGLFVTSKNYLYGIADFNGQIVIDNICDDIYTPSFDKMIIVYNNEVYEIPMKRNTDIDVPYDIRALNQGFDEINLIDVASNPFVSTGYYGITITDYMLKIFSSISPAYEQTIDELMLSQGADTVSVLMKLEWIPKFPVVYVKQYAKAIAAPYGGPLSNVKREMKRKIKD